MTGVQPFFLPFWLWAGGGETEATPRLSSAIDNRFFRRREGRVSPDPFWPSRTIENRVKNFSAGPLVIVPQSNVPAALTRCTTPCPRACLVPDVSVPL